MGRGRATVPMPVLVRVTNLKNGRATVLRTLLVAHAAIPLVVLGSPAAAGAAGGLRTPPRYLGALVASLSSSDRIRLSLSSTDAGVAIVGLDAGSPAERARLGVGDLIVSADGRPIYSPRGLDAILRRHPPSSSLPLTVRRGQETHAVSVTLEELPRGDLGFEVAPLVDRPDIRAQMPRGSTAPPPRRSVRPSNARSSPTSSGWTRR